MKPLTSYKSYKMVFGGIFFGGLLVFLVFFVPHAAHAQCGAVPAGGDYTATTSCTFAGTVDGVDNGGITINGGVTLTINAGQTIVWGPGQSIVINGSIAINSTGQLRQTRLWMIDGDSDGYASSTAQVAQDISPGAGYRNRAALTSFTVTDVNESNASTWQNLNCYSTTDSDGDGHTPNYTVSVEAGASCPGGYSSSAGTDCDEACPNCYVGSTVDTSAPDGLDQDCNGVFDENIAKAQKECTGTPGQAPMHRPLMEDACDSYCEGYDGVLTCSNPSNSTYSCQTYFPGCGYGACYSLASHAICNIYNDGGASWVRCDCPPRYQ